MTVYTTTLSAYELAMKDMLSTAYATEAKAKAVAKGTTQSLAGSYIVDFALTLADGGSSILARWKCGQYTGTGSKRKLVAQQHIDHFLIDWEYYDTKTNKWHQGGNGTKSVGTSSKAGGFYQDMFSMPSVVTANKVRARVKAVSKEHEVTTYYEKKEKSGKKTVVKKVAVKTKVKYWTLNYSAFKYYDFTAKVRPAVPAAPSAELLDNGFARVSWGGFERPTTCILVYRYSKKDGYAPGKGKKVAPNHKSGKHLPADVFQNESGGSYIDEGVKAGNRYRYMCQAHDYDAVGSKEYSESDKELANANRTDWWLQNCLSAEVQTRPLDPKKQTAKYYGMSGDDARVEVSWEDNGWAGDSYEIRYAETLALLKVDGGYETYNPSLVFSGGGASKSCVVNVEAGKTWFFRVVVKNSNSGKMGYSAFGNYAQCIAGERPSAPTLQSMEPYYAIGDEPQASWTHNAPDKSEQRAAQVSVSVNGAENVHDVPGETSSFAIGTSAMPPDADVVVRVRTKGAIEDWSDWSAPVQFTVLAPPQCYISASFPNPLHDPNEEGSDETVQLSDGGTLEQLPFICALTSGGTDRQAPVSWFLELVAASTFPYVDVLGDDSLMLAGTQMMSITVDPSNSDFDASEQRIAITAADGAFVSGGEYLLRAYVVTDAGLRSEYATLAFTCEWATDMPTPSMDGMFDIESCTMALTPACYREVWPDDYDPDTDDGTTEPMLELMPDVTLDVYRIGYDGALVAVATGIANTGDVCVVDKYPSFGECSYRVVANDPHTDAMSVYETPPIQTPKYGLFIQWDSERYAGIDEDTQEPVYEGESVFLPWNIGVSEAADPDRELVGYIGRENPVAYFGTQLGISGSWTTEIVKFEDKELLAQLRKLQRWQGTCYVRETSGVGYRAVVSVEFGRTYDNVAMSVTIGITKVEEE